ncbi:MAG TPA: ATP-dependent DNA helicase, partial [Terriglobia bacterium]|nr:ATP-dependent DNA helicase [Terriglobia bacterium]
MRAQTQSAKQKVSLEKIFGHGGWLARHHPRYEYRQSQLEMAEEVESALENHRHLIAEAGTGTGKTLAYLVPILRS